MKSFGKYRRKLWKDMKNMEDFCVSHNYTQRDLLLLLPRRRWQRDMRRRRRWQRYTRRRWQRDIRRRRRRRRPPPFIHVYTLFFRIEKNRPEIVFFLLETMQVGIKFTISLIRLSGYLVPLQWERRGDRLLGVHSEHIRKHGRWKPLLKYIILYENKMAGKGQITRARKR